MSIGFASCIVIGLFIKTELSYDDFHVKKDQIYRLLSFDQESGQYSADVTYRLGPDCVDHIPGVEKFARLYSFWGPYTISQNDQAFSEDDLYYTDPSIVDIFSFDFVEGDQMSALNGPGTVIITSSVSKKYFGEEPALGKSLTLDNEYNLTVSGVVRNFPANSHFHFDLLVYDPSRLEGFGDWINQAWDFSNFKTYLLLSKNFSEEQFSKELESFAQKNVDDENKENISKTKLQRLSDVHLYSKSVANDFASKGSISIVMIFISVAISILLIASINYISQNISNVSKRIREVGVRKVNGAGNAQIIGQHIFETTLLYLISLAFALILVSVIYSLFPGYVNLYFNISNLASIPFLVYSIGTALLIAILSGIYVASDILKARPLGLIKGNRLMKSTGFSKSYIYLSIQFSISIILIVSTGFIYKQLKYIQNADLGYNDELILSVPISKTPGTAQVLKENLLKNPQIREVTFSSSFPPNENHYSNIQSLDDPADKIIEAKNFFADFNFIDFMEMKIVQGRNFIPDSKQDEQQGALINKAFAEEMGWESPIGKRLKNGWGNKELVVLGVVDDFHFKSMHDKIEPALISISLDHDLYYLGVKLSNTDFQSSLRYIKSEWEKVNPKVPFEYNFLDETTAQYYEKDREQARIILIFSILAIAITCLGLIAISMFLSKQRTKEIGIRKVNGAKVWEVLTMLNKDFVKWVFIAFAIATPVAWYAMKKWLENFAYKTELSWWVFVLAGILALGIALLTVSWQSWKAATRNPVEALRYE